ncbi:MAG: type II toxin-antitoxin system HicB family antitoxin [Planctomycetes bacterium]|nr:type II toxin-antitoxin system HicB family antitoxin [Planctomycetota bacterium]
MNYPIVIHKDRDSDYGVTVPDLPGCFTAGSTLDEALAMAREAVELHLEGLIEHGEAVPRPGAMEDHRHNPDYKGGVWAVVSVSPADLRVKAKRINVSIPQRVLDAVDRFAKAENETRSGLLVKAATAYIRQTPRGPKRRRTREKK